MARTRRIRLDVRFTDEAAIEAYQRCGSVAAAALDLGVSYSALSGRFKLIDFVTKKRPRPKKADGGRSRRAKHQEKMRDRNRDAGRCLNETRNKTHPLPIVNPRTGEPYSKCEPCRLVHKGS